MFRVVHKDQNDFSLDFYVNMHNVYDVKKDLESNEIMFLFYDPIEGWIYRPAENYVPVNQK